MKAFIEKLKALKASALQWIKSKTIWFSAVGIPATLQLLHYVQQNIHLVKENLGASYMITSFFLGAIGVLLRNLTTKPLSEK